MLFLVFIIVLDFVFYRFLQQPTTPPLIFKALTLTFRYKTIVPSHSPYNL